MRPSLRLRLRFLFLLLTVQFAVEYFDLILFFFYIHEGAHHIIPNKAAKAQRS